MSQKAGLLDPAEQVSRHLHLSVVFELCHYLLIVFNSLMSIVFLELLCKKWAIPIFLEISYFGYDCFSYEVKAK